MAAALRVFTARALRLPWVATLWGRGHHDGVRPSPPGPCRAAVRKVLLLDCLDRVEGFLHVPARIQVRIHVRDGARRCDDVGRTAGPFRLLVEDGVVLPCALR